MGISACVTDTDPDPVCDLLRATLALLAPVALIERLPKTAPDAVLAALAKSADTRGLAVVFAVSDSVPEATRDVVG